MRVTPSAIELFIYAVTIARMGRYLIPIIVIAAGVLAVVGFIARLDPNGVGLAGGPEGQTLADARATFTTKIVRREAAAEPVAPPPVALFNVVKYDSAVGPLAAYLSVDPKDGKKHPAIVWITGGDCNTIGDVWSPQPRDNDQSAAAYRNAGIVMMFPSLRGGNQNPGVRENFYGEVNDVLAAADFLAKQPFVDPKRIYLGGHSTGGTLVLLTAEYSPRFRATFSFGPVASGDDYGEEFMSYDPASKSEVQLRSPGRWLASAASPVFVFEGEDQGNVSSLNQMSRKCKNPLVQFFPVPGESHFSVLAPMNDVIAKKILADTGDKSNISFTASEVRR